MDKLQYSPSILKKICDKYKQYIVIDFGNAIFQEVKSKLLMLYDTFLIIIFHIV